MAPFCPAISGRLSADSDCWLNTRNPPSYLSIPFISDEIGDISCTRVPRRTGPLLVAMGRLSLRVGPIVSSAGSPQHGRATRHGEIELDPFGDDLACGAGEPRRAKRRQARGREWREVDAPRRTVEDQFAHRLAGRGRVEHAPDTVAGRYVDAVNTRQSANERQAVRSDWPETRLPRFDRRGGERGRDVPAQRFDAR